MLAGSFFFSGHSVNFLPQTSPKFGDVPKIWGRPLGGFFGGDVMNTNWGVGSFVNKTCRHQLSQFHRRSFRSNSPPRSAKSIVCGIPSLPRYACRRRVAAESRLSANELLGGGVAAAYFNNTTSYPLFVTSHITTKILSLGDVPKFWGRPQDVLGGLGRVGGRKFTK